MMFIVAEYQKELSKIPQYSDQEFMAVQIWQLQHVFNNQLASIKNTNHEFVAFTKEFIKEFNADSSLLGHTAAMMTGMSEDNCCEIHKQEQQIFATRGFRDSVYLLKNK